MTRTQIQIPDALYDQAKRLAEAREISLAELVRRGLEYMLSVSAPAQPGKASWDLPAPLRLGSDDPFVVPDWRFRLHLGEGMVAEPQAEYRTAKKPRGRSRP
jgi:hypothetical protein